MRRVKSRQLVTGRFHRTASAGALALAFLVAMTADNEAVLPGHPVGAEPPVRAAQPMVAARSAAAASAPAAPRGALAALPLGDGAEDDAGDGAAGFDPAPVPADPGAAPADPKAVSGPFAPPPGMARDPHADRPTPQQLEHLIGLSQIRSGSEGRGD